MSNAGKVDEKMYTYSKNNGEKLECYLGLETLAASAEGAYRVIAQSVSAALACTSAESCDNSINKNLMNLPTFKMQHGHYLHIGPSMFRKKQVIPMDPFLNKLKLL